MDESCEMYIFLYILYIYINVFFIERALKRRATYLGYGRGCLIFCNIFNFSSLICNTKGSAFLTL